MHLILRRELRDSIVQKVAPPTFTNTALSGSDQYFFPLVDVVTCAGVRDESQTLIVSVLCKARARIALCSKMYPHCIY